MDELDACPDQDAIDLRGVCHAYLATHRGLIVKDGARKEARWSLLQHQDRRCLLCMQKQVAEH